MAIEKLTVRGKQLIVHTYGGEAPLQLMGMRVASASLGDDWTAELIKWLPEYKRHGLNSAVIFIQGSSGGRANPTGEYVTDTDNPMNWEGDAASFCQRNGRYLFEPHPVKRCHQSAFHINEGYRPKGLNRVSEVVFLFRIFEYNLCVPHKCYSLLAQELGEQAYPA